MQSTSRMETDEIRTGGAGWPTERPAYANLQAAIQGESSRWNVPGMAAGLLHDGKTDICVTGAASIETGFPVTPKTLFQIGSISKIFAATLVMRLCEQGVLDLDTPVVKWVEDLPLADANTRQTVTLRHLLSHTSGFEGDRFVDYGRGEDALAKAIAAFGSLRQWFTPGSLWSYNNAGFYLAGLVIERATGKGFEKVLTDEIFTPLGLERTVLLPEYAMTYAHSVGHDIDREKGPSIVRPFSYARHIAAAGGVISCPSDMLRFVRMHLNDGELDGERIISAESAQEMRTAISPAEGYKRSYGMGWSRWDYDDAVIVDHGGSIAGFRAYLTVIPERNFALIQLTNGSTGYRVMQEVEAWALDHELGLRREQRPFISLPEEALSHLAGTYTRHDSRLTVTAQEGGLHVHVESFDEQTGEPKGTPVDYDLKPVMENQFRVTSVEGHGTTVDFITHPAPDGAEQALMRFSGRLSCRNEA